MDYHLIVFIVVVLFWIVRGIYRGFQWLAKQIVGGAAGPSPAELARQRMLAEAQRTATGQASQASGQATQTGNRATGSYRPAQTARPASPARQPQAGGPAVPYEATTEEFQTQTRQLVADEPAPLQTPLASTPPVSDQPRILTLFAGPDDLLRAIILQEALGPPLSRRHPSPIAVENAPPA